ncbi:MAG: flippase-like domain-containing protein [Ignavibacteria bacterium]|nr:flippase-like domain-containing protein [Ignavibacteria bacterium]
MKYKKTLRILIGVIIFGLALWWVFSLTDLQSFAEIIEHANLPLLSMCVPLIIVSHWLRAIRWKRLLPSYSKQISTYRAFSAVMIGYAANTVVPRSGEIIRPLVLSNRTAVPASAALSSVIMERILDVLTLLVAIGVIVVLQQGLFTRVFPNLSIAAALSSVLFPIALLILLIAVIVFTNLGERLVAILGKPLSKKWQQKLIGIIHGIREGSSLLRYPKVWPVLGLESILMWALYIVPLLIVYHSISFATQVEFGFADAAVMLVVIAVGVTIAPTPGALGVYQGFAQAAMITLYGATPEEGLAFGVLAWVVNYGTAMVVGGLCLVDETRHGFRLKKES